MHAGSALKAHKLAEAQGQAKLNTRMELNQIRAQFKLLKKSTSNSYIQLYM